MPSEERAARVTLLAPAPLPVPPTMPPTPLTPLTPLTPPTPVSATATLTVEGPEDGPETNEIEGFAADSEAALTPPDAGPTGG